MKRIHNFGKLPLCCSMLSCTAFAAGPESHQVDGIKITFDDPAKAGRASLESVLLEMERIMLERGTLDDAGALENSDVRLITEPGEFLVGM